MKTIALTLALISTTSLAAPKKPATPPDLPPDASSAMYRAELGARARLTTAGDGLDPIVHLGERNIAWLVYINSFRPDGQKLSFTSKETQRGIPIDAPKEYNVPLIQQKLAEVKAQVPAAMQEILWNDKAQFPKVPPVQLEDYLTASRELDRVFQTALRWRMMVPWLSYLESRRHNDLRGWYFLSRLPDRPRLLREFDKQPEFLRAQLRTWLINVCFNSDSSDDIRGCTAVVDGMITKKQDLEQYYQRLAARPAGTFHEYFEIPDGAARSEIRWVDGRVVAPFEDPGTQEVRDFLKVNIEDEWRFQDWRLELPFAHDSAIPHVEFEHNVTPHVNGIGGDTITMNADQPLTEYDAQWTIRHEYGHVLGFPDCYVEFYERERNVIVNYQFDVDNLMCSRRGHILQTHVNEMKRAYQK